MPAWESDNPSTAPHFIDRVGTDQPGRDARSHCRSHCAKRRNGPEAANEDYVKDEIHQRHRDAQDHRRACVAGGAQGPARHKENKQTKAEGKSYAKKRQGLGFDPDIGGDEIQQIRSGKIAYRGHNYNGHECGGEKCLIDGSVYLSFVAGTGKTRDEHIHAGK